MKVQALVRFTTLALTTTLACSEKGPSSGSTDTIGTDAPSGTTTSASSTSSAVSTNTSTTTTATSTVTTTSAPTGTTGTSSSTTGGSGGSGSMTSQDSTTSGNNGTSQSSSTTSDGTSGTDSSSDTTSQAPVVPNPPPLQNGQDGHATHYWDCCKPSCAWPDQGSAHACTLENQPQGNRDDQSGCFGGNSYQCWSMAPWAVSDTLAYGFAAFNAGGCGLCYQLEFTGTSSAGYDDPGAASLSNKIMIVQTVNRGGIAGGQFDLLVPGGGVGDFDACSRQWNAAGNLGERYGGFFLECRKQNGDHGAIKSCARNRCEQMFAEPNEADLLAGCLFWVDWANVADNPNFKFGQVPCPEAISAVSGM